MARCDGKKVGSVCVKKDCRSIVHCVQNNGIEPGISVKDLRDIANHMDIIRESIPPGCPVVSAGCD